MSLAVFLVHVSLTAGIVKAGGGHVLPVVSIVPFECGGHDCHRDQVCLHRIYHGVLRSYCRSLLEAQNNYAASACTQLPTSHNACYCVDAACNTNIYNLIYQQNHVNPLNVPLVCGGHTCVGHEKCHINVTSNRRIYFHCTKHEQRHCLPNLLTHGGCVCDTTACVEQNLISIVAGHQVSGLICDDHDDHVCQPNDVCTIVHEYGHFNKHCVHPSHIVGTECTALPALHHQCYCTTQECIYGQFIAHVTTTIPTSATSSSTFAPIVTAAPSVATSAQSGTTEAVLQSTIKPIQQNTEASTQQNTMEPTQTTSTTATCTDIEDGTFSCADYANQFNLCSATLAAQPTLYNIANKRCRHFCGICGTGTGGSTGTGSGNTMIYQFTCMDHDTRCSLFSAQICSPTVSHDYVVSTCAKTCNLCPEYLASLKGLTTPPTTHQSTAESTQQSTVTPIYTTTTHSGPCLDKPGVDCNILNTTNICANILAARKYCAAYCGLC